MVARLALFLHHANADREFAYDRKSHVGTLDNVLDMAGEHDWIIFPSAVSLRCRLRLLVLHNSAANSMLRSPGSRMARSTQSEFTFVPLLLPQSSICQF